MYPQQSNGIDNSRGVDNVRTVKKQQREQYDKLMEEKNKMFSNINYLQPIKRETLIKKLKKIFDNKYELSDNDYIIIIDKFHLENKVSKENIRELIVFLDTQLDYRQNLFIQDKINLNSTQYIDNNKVIKQNINKIEKERVMEKIKLISTNKKEINKYKNMSTEYSPDIPNITFNHLRNISDIQPEITNNIDNVNLINPNIENSVKSNNFLMNNLKSDTNTFQGKVNNSPESINTPVNTNSNINNKKEIYNDEASEKMDTIISLINEFKNNIEEKINKTLNSSDTVSIKTNVSDTKLITISLLKNEINGKFIINLDKTLKKYSKISFHSIHSNKTFIEKNNIHKNSLCFIDIENIKGNNEFIIEKFFNDKKDTNKNLFFSYFNLIKAGHFYTFINTDINNGDNISIPGKLKTLNIQFYNSNYALLKNYNYTDNDCLNIIFKLSK
tara:strand:+ start:71 stop:1402 length:1332 start_codon:yes stop_codon:yes gene_type:complete